MKYVWYIVKKIDISDNRFCQQILLPRSLKVIFLLFFLKVIFKTVHLRDFSLCNLNVFREFVAFLT